MKCPDGALVGQPIKILDFQHRFFEDVFDHPEVRTAILSASRKTGKTTLVACIVLAYLCGPLASIGANAQIVSAALSRDQAALVFNACVKIIRFNPKLADLLVIRDSKREVFCPQSGSTYRALSADAGSNMGLNPSVIVADEIGSWGAKSDLYDALTTSTAAQAAPLFIAISTQAANDGDLLSVLIDDALASNDPRVVCHLHTAPPDMDPYSEPAWYAANPALGHSVSLDFYRDRADRAKRLPAEQNGFENLCLNRRVVQHAALVPSALWNKAACGFDEDLSGAICYAGLDLSQRTDLTALALLFPRDGGRFLLKVQYFAPEIGVLDREKRDRVPYTAWARAGWLTLTPGSTVSLESVTDVIHAAQQRHDVQLIGYDRWHADAFKQVAAIKGYDFPMEPAGQGFATMTPAIDTFLGWLLEERLTEEQNPVTRFCAASAVIKTDPAGNRKPDKSKSTGRIDGIAATLCAVHAYTKQPPSEFVTSDLLFA